MVDTVWLKLTRKDGKESFYMFGPTGVVEFARSEETNTTHLVKSRGVQTDEVIEEPAYIMQMLGKIRKTIVPDKRKNDRKVKGRNKR